MRHVDITHAKPGMVIAQSVPGPGGNGKLPLLAAGVTLTETIHERLVRAGVASVLISDQLSEGIQPTPPINDEVRKQAVAAVRATYASIGTTSSHVTPGQMASVERVMDSVISSINEQQRLLVCLSDLNVFGGDQFQRAVNTCVLGTAIGIEFLNEHGWTDFRGQQRIDGIKDRLLKLGTGLLLQDIGVLAVPPEIRDKRGMLSSSEREIMQQHPLLGLEMLGASDISPLVRVTVAQHHERADGSGYPRGLDGDDIHDNGVIAAVADTFISLTMREQPGTQQALAPHEAWDLIARASGTLFKPGVVDAFRKVVSPYGPGTMVRLNDRRYAIVTSAVTDEPHRPDVRIVADAEGTPVAEQLELQLVSGRGLRVAEVVPGLPGDRAVA